VSSPTLHAYFGANSCKRARCPYCNCSALQVLVLNPKLLVENSNKQLIADDLSSKVWADVDGKLLLFGTGDEEPKPSRRARALHAMLALQHAQQEGWLEAPLRKVFLSAADFSVDEAAWASPTFDTARMDAFLTDPASLLADKRPLQP
jgi:hypothetical protein